MPVAADAVPLRRELVRRQRVERAQIRVEL
jgi:hypothetical protein